MKQARTECGCGGHETVSDSCGCGGHDEAAQTCACGGHETVSDSCGCGGHETADVCACGGHETVSDSCGCGGHDAAKPAPAHGCGCGGSAPVRSRHGYSGMKLKTMRRIHAASGFVFALFLLMHMTANAISVQDAAYGQVVGLIHAAIQAVPGITLVLVFLPLSIQIVTGIYLVYKNSLYYDVKCNRGNSLRFFLQRVSGVAILVFVVLHLGTLHGWGSHAVLHTGSAHLAGYDPHHLFLPGILGTLGFLIGVCAAVYHLANGAITGTHVWGLFDAPAVRFWLRRICAGGGVALACVAMLAWFVFLGHGILPGV